MKLMMTMAAATMLLAACSSEVEQAEREIATLKAARGTYADLCASRKKVSAAYLAQGNVEKYQFAKVLEGNDCLANEIEPGSHYRPSRT